MPNPSLTKGGRSAVIGLRRLLIYFCVETRKAWARHAREEEQRGSRRRTSRDGGGSEEQLKKKYKSLFAAGGGAKARLLRASFLEDVGSLEKLAWEKWNLDYSAERTDRLPD